jgi:hypothetical protein
VENMRPSDVINVMKVYFEATKHFGESLQQNEQEIADLTPDELADLDKIVGEIETRDNDRGSKESEVGSDDGEEDSEDSGDETD